MDVSKLSLEKLHNKLQAISLLSQKPFQKYPEEVIQLVSEAFARGMSIRQIHSMSQIPQPSLSYIRKRIRSAKKAEDGGRRDFIKIKVEEPNASQKRALARDRVSMKVDASGLMIEIGIDSLTPHLLQTLRSFL